MFLVILSKPNKSALSCIMRLIAQLSMEHAHKVFNRVVLLTKLPEYIIFKIVQICKTAVRP